MTAHKPAGYACPFCRLLAGGETERNRQADIVYRDEHATAFVSPKWWPENAGHVLVVPNEHFENIHEIPDEALGRVYAAARKIAVAVRATYDCGGTSTRQHNEPGGGQDVWHFHVHVFPRTAGDRLYERNDEARWTTPEQRAPYAERLRAYLDE
jgi:histidine triad (HIT) family protein